MYGTYPTCRTFINTFVSSADVYGICPTYKTSIETFISCKMHMEHILPIKHPLRLF